MKTLVKTLFVLALVGALVILALGFGLFALIGDLSGLHITVNGDEVLWSGWEAGDLFGAGLGLLISAVVVCMVVCVVVPLALLLGIGLPLLILGGLLLAGVVAVLGVGTVLGAPLLLIGLVIWLLLRDRPARAARTSLP